MSKFDVSRLEGARSINKYFTVAHLALYLVNTGVGGNRFKLKVCRKCVNLTASVDIYLECFAQKRVTLLEKCLGILGIFGVRRRISVYFRCYFRRPAL